MANFHDGIIESYKVNFFKNRIIFNIKKEDDIITNNIRIIFKDFLCYKFNNEMSNSIITDIEKHSIEKFITDNNELLDSKKNYCWPISYDTKEDLIRIVKEGYNYYNIYSAYGLNGWVLSKKILYK